VLVAIPATTSLGVRHLNLLAHGLLIVRDLSTSVFNRFVFGSIAALRE